MLRRIIGAALATACAAGLTVASSSTPASAAGSCTLTAPSRVSIWKPYQAITLKASGACTTGGSAAWELVHPTYGLENIAYFDGTSTDTWDLYDWDDIGKQTWRPAGAYDSAYNSLTQNSPVSDIRYYGAAWISTSRSSSVVTLNGTSLVYSPDTGGFVRRPYAVGVFQYREIGSTVWRNLKQVTTNSNGVVTLRYTYAPTRDYRFATYSTSTVWDVGSATSRR
ncbi:hypothetical protein G9U51_01820 [Calidifontibacter sp. DB0510]|uniref:Uncharacterized protein n=1 Tax=Metallococcus carri TaxID=1656884 RepID=A0A967AXH1_9MICO|nr:hypothetical protein [Metallococcus carri]NHN54518.1 hypothetical protein [Metallococcus carri]NOP36643.1 hypothetical protein [Calidifontibacter sp. DB2511S]